MKEVIDYEYSKNTARENRSSDVFHILSNESKEYLESDHNAMVDWVKGITHDIIQEHMQRIGKSVRVQYIDGMEGETLVGYLPFQYEGVDEEDDFHVINITLPNQTTKLNPVTYPHIVHHELSHIYNDEYDHLAHGRLSDEMISQLNEIDEDNIYNNVHIESGTMEVITDLTALQMQGFSSNSWISFLATVEWFLDVGESMEEQRGLLRDLVRFYSIVSELKNNFPGLEQSNGIESRLFALIEVLKKNLQPIQLQELEGTIEYMQKLSKEFYD